MENYGEKKIVGYIDDGESISLRTQCTDAKNALRSVHKMDLGGIAVALDGGRSRRRIKDDRSTDEN